MRWGYFVFWLRTQSRCLNLFLVESSITHKKECWDHNEIRLPICLPKTKPHQDAQRVAKRFTLWKKFVLWTKSIIKAVSNVCIDLSDVKNVDLTIVFAIPLSSSSQTNIKVSFGSTCFFFFFQILHVYYGS